MKWKDLEPWTVWIQNMNRSVCVSSCHQRALMCGVVAPWLSCLSKTWSVSLKPGEPASCPPLSTSPWRTWTCGSLLLKTAVSTTSIVLFFIIVIIIDLTVNVIIIKSRQFWRSTAVCCEVKSNHLRNRKRWNMQPVCLRLCAFVRPFAVNAVYNLYAVSNHSGTTMGGHYTAYCRNPNSGEWYTFNDSR